MNKTELTKVAKKYHKSGLSCSEAMLRTFLPLLGEKDEYFRIATPFCAGIGRKRDLCGILTGGVMVIGFKYGRKEATDVCAKEKSSALAAEYYDWFQKNYKCTCKEILPDEFKGSTEKCTKILEASVEYLHNKLFM